MRMSGGIDKKIMKSNHSLATLSKMLFILQAGMFAT